MYPLYLAGIPQIGRFAASLKISVFLRKISSHAAVKQQNGILQIISDIHFSPAFPFPRPFSLPSLSVIIAAVFPVPLSGSGGNILSDAAGGGVFGRAPLHHRFTSLYTE